MEIKNITDTSGLEGVYFEDIDDLVTSKSECLLIVKWYFYYFSSLRAAELFLAKHINL